MSDGEADAPPPPPSGPWEAPPELQAFAARLVRTRRHRGLGPRCERLRFAGEAIDRFAAGREYSATLAGRVDPRWARKELDRDELPESVTKGMRRCQKPFHLWNVERVEHDDDLAFQREDGLRVGRAAALPEELRVPRRLEKASRALRDWLEDQAFREAMLKMDRKRFERLLRDPLPFGRKDDEPARAGDDDDVLVIGPPGPGGGRALPEHIAAFIRRPGGLPPRVVPDRPDDDDARVTYIPVPGPGGFDMSQPDDAGANDGDGDGGGFGGFDMSQPEDDDDAGGGPGGFDLSQPDDDDDGAPGGGFGGFDLSQD